MAEINLLPRKAFEITLDDKTVIKGQYSLWSVKRYCDKKRLSLSAMTEQLSADNISFDDVVQLLLCAVEYSMRKEKQTCLYTDIDVCDWIEEMGGMMSEKYTALMNHAKSEDEGEDSEEKKSQLSSQTSNGFVTQPV